MATILCSGFWIVLYYPPIKTDATLLRPAVSTCKQSSHATLIIADLLHGYGFGKGHWTLTGYPDIPSSHPCTLPQGSREHVRLYRLGKEGLFCASMEEWSCVLNADFHYFRTTHIPAHMPSPTIVSEPNKLTGYPGWTMAALRLWFAISYESREGE